MEWIRELSEINFLAVYALALDIKDELQLVEEPITVPIKPRLKRFGKLDFDDYYNLRYKTFDLLARHNLILKKEEVLKHPIGSRGNYITAIKLSPTASFQPFVEALENEFKNRAQLNEVPQTANKGAKTPESNNPAAPEFEKITLTWLKNHVPVKLWWGFGGACFVILSAAFSFGVYSGKIGIVNKVIGNYFDVKQLEPATIQAQIDFITKGYNERINNINNKIVFLEGRATNLEFSRSETDRSVANLRSEADREHKKYLEDVATLRKFRVNN